MFSQKPLLVRTALTLLVVVILASLTLVPGSAATQNLTFNPVADSYVDSANPTVTHGTATTFRVDGSPVVNSYLRFTVSGVGAQAVSQARLLIYPNSASSQGLVAKSVANNTWAETTLNYSNAPAMGGSLATSPAVVAATWVTLDVTAYVTGDGTYSFGVSTPGATAISLAARESGATAPQLIVTVNSSTTPVPSNTSTKTPAATPVSTNTPATTPVNTATSTVVPTVTKTPAPGTPTATSLPGTCTAVILTKGPTLIYTGVNTQMRIFWQWTSNATFQMQWGTSTSYSQGNIAVNPTDTTNHLYHYDISGLTPGTKYYYREVVGTQCVIGTFFAAPAASATTVKFTSYGDTRTNGGSHNTIAGQVVSLFTSDPAFQSLNINVGDWVSADSSSAWASEWFAPAYTNIRKQDASLSDIGIRGNHEGSATFLKQYWPEPFQPGGLYWSFDYGPMHVVLMDSYTAYTVGSAQYNWIKADLAASTKTWKIVAIHEPGWSANGGHPNNTTVQTVLQPLFVQYGVAMVLSGHNHYYARAMVGGIAHLTVGGGGAPLYPPASGQPNIVVANKTYSFGEFTINGKTLTAKIVNSSGATIDTFTITK